VIQVVFETHSISEDNERGAASGWNHSRLSARGRELAAELGRRRGDDGLAAVFASDLRRAAETAEIAFGQAGIPVLLDWRLRECDYGDRNGGPTRQHLPDRARFLDEPYPGGESWRAATARVAGFLGDLSSRWQDRRVLIIGHVATRWALDHYLGGVPLEDLAGRDFSWQEGWEYTLAAAPALLPAGSVEYRGGSGG
jgi:2,3-bisphosphoglycerate-dependent phosphoglycerate mutase